jgi:ribosomal protein S18 acetylase RimI-like enzyme
MRHDEVVFQQASMLDIPLFLHWLEQGALRRIFNEELVTFLMQLQMYRQAAPATKVWRRAPFLPAVGGRTLLRARAGGETQGLVMLHRRGEHDYVIEYIMVGDAFRRRGVARRMVDGVVALLPERTTVTARCSPEAREMIGLFGRMGFRIVGRSRPQKGRRVMPWELRFTKTQPQPLAA